MPAIVAIKDRIVRKYIGENYKIWIVRKAVYQKIGCYSESCICWTFDVSQSFSKGSLELLKSLHNAQFVIT